MSERNVREENLKKCHIKNVRKEMIESRDFTLPEDMLETVHMVMNEDADEIFNLFKSLAAIFLDSQSSGSSKPLILYWRLLN